MKAEIETKIREALHNGNTVAAETLILEVQSHNHHDDAVYYWLGNLHRQRNNWRLALQYYAQAIELNPQSPALEARQMLMNIIQFRDVQRYNV